MARLGIQVNRRIAEALVEQGIIDPSGKTRQELQHEVQTRIRALPQDGFEPGASVVIDYRDDLLHEARRFVRRRQYSFALLFYATHFEHWINYRIGTALNRQGFTNEQIAHFIQGVGDVRRKNLLLRVLGAPSISDHVVGVVMQVAERRNAYVHYKWTPKPLDARSDEQVSQERLLKSAEKAVARLRHIDNRPFRGQKRVLFPSMSRRAIERADATLQEVYRHIRETGTIPTARQIGRMDGAVREVRKQRRTPTKPTGCDPLPTAPVLMSAGRLSAPPPHLLLGRAASSAELG